MDTEAKKVRTLRSQIGEYCRAHDLTVEGQSSTSQSGKVGAEEPRKTEGATGQV